MARRTRRKLLCRRRLKRIRPSSAAFEEVLTRGDPEAIRELLAPDFVDHRPLPGDEDPGPEGYIRFLADALSLPSAATAL